ncbi:NAD(P)/FAD-dependent oxidoreductase [Streptomyces sp. JJ38]|uniref:NAD(P)/FAD-dependent oxidoreductase n=1 Tax=Streptomyces sp. JJ38 TaxID=2738128 RepID=UPI001C561661|nr:tryptophan 7-halogenase [Streptomyces sp. JJ38]MBW1599700.1 NAD(P)-binding protein [Streptomyces sp. JJ38]
MNDQSQHSHDVAILGTGLAGSVLGAILAKAGHRVLLLDAGTHPRFAIGESTVGYTLVHLRMLANRYGVPEVGHLGSLDECIKYIGSSSGVKKHFGFMIHRDGKEPDPREINQFRLPKVLHTASHYFRQDVDAYLFNTAVRYGCEAKQNCRVEKVDIDDDGVTLQTTRGETHRVRYIVDGSGFRSPLATQFGLRAEPNPLKHHARSIFTHMTGVKRVDDLTRGLDTPPLPWHEGTMHHMFDRGWFWIIPFDNHPQSTNPLCSVGVQLDPRRYPKPADMTPEQEFWHHVDRFPLVKRQLAEARSVREWVGTDRLQYTSTQTVGYRYALLSHAAGFIDPLFSRGMSNTAEVINVLAWRLLRALRNDDFDPEQFEYVERLQQGLIHHNDRLVNSAFISFQNYDLWNAVFRIWSYGSLPGAFRVIHEDEKARATGDHGYWKGLEDVPNPGLWWPDKPEYKEIFEVMADYCEAVDAGEMKAQDAADRLFARLRRADWIPPSLGIANENVKFIDPNPKALIKMLRWSARQAPADMRDYMVGTSVSAIKHFVRGKRIF